MRRAQPKEGIEYTFRFYKDGKVSLTTLIYDSVNDKGRLVFYNKQSGAFTTMLPNRFSYIHRFNLVRELPIKIVPKERRLVELDPKFIKDVSIIEEGDQFTEYNKFKSAAEEERCAIEKGLQMPYNTFLDTVKKFCEIPGTSSDPEWRSFVESGKLQVMRKASDILNSLRCKDIIV
ncbi:MAG: hypothetical protein IJW47_01525 [Clostridia bacterium]|nr:hypothetical protein [Clostridia bacterium]